MALNPIACELCRAKKSKCDRTLPRCSPCQQASLPCRYAQGGKRGIPAAYINTLEERLAETEQALCVALAAVDSIPSLPVPALGPVANPHDRSKADKQDEWKRLPLRSADQLERWYEQKKQSLIPSRQHSQHPQHPQHPQPTDRLPILNENTQLPNPLQSQWRNYF